MGLKRTKKIDLPLLPLRGLTVFPHMILHFDVGRKKSVAALEHAMRENQQILLVAQINGNSEDPTLEDLYKFGCISKIKQILKLPGGGIRVLVEGEGRAHVEKFIDEDPCVIARIIPLESVNKETTPGHEALMRQAKELFEEYFYLYNKLPTETMISVMNIEDGGELADIIASNIFAKIEDRQAILEELDTTTRLEKVIGTIYRETEILELEKNIAHKVKTQIDKNQRNYFLREQIKAIQEELGDSEGIAAEVTRYKKRINSLKLGTENETKLIKEANRLSKMPPAASDSGVIRTYLDTVLELPWNKQTKDRFNIPKAERILNADHYGLSMVKERILECLAVRTLAKDIKGPILCLVGPPGVGKTSIAKSIARAMGRKYVRMSLGGIRDEAEIRGHRKTYVGAMPGRIITSIRNAGSCNPLILLDEIDKISNDFRGDPYSALLEVLDSEQNFAFRDHYIEIPFDLSEIFFITTANSLDTIPRPLLDRMEVIEVSGYTSQEKEEIALKYLLPKQRTLHGLKASNFKLDLLTIRDIISYYTREAGVRNLERKIGNVCRKSAKILVESIEPKRISVTPLNLEEFLGKHKFRLDSMLDSDEIGVATGLAWTSVGGDTLSIEANVMTGSGKVELTGHLGDIMKESATAAISFIRSRVTEFGIDKDFYKNMDIHIHVPEGATPKDGPSAGITIASALVSALTKIPVRRDVAMTGEITLRGRVLPIGGLKEKALAAFRTGIRTIILPLENECDIDDIPQSIREQVKFVTVDNMNKVLLNVLSEQKMSVNKMFLSNIQDYTVEGNLQQ